MFGVGLAGYSSALSSSFLGFRSHGDRPGHAFWHILSLCDFQAIEDRDLGQIQNECKYRR
jgi:hypothetical protein